MILNFNHLGYASTNFDEDLKSLSLLGYQPTTSAIVDPLLNVKVMFLKGIGPTIELVSPINSSKHMDVWLKQRAKTYHYAYNVKDINSAVDHFTGLGCIIVQAPLPAIAFSERRVCFIMLENRVLVELIEDE